jgi:pimeloyl-ACP methyl ester carboxylesterase
MTRAELKYYTPPADCTGVLVLCPGWNNDGAHWIKDAQWQEFARKQKLALVGLSFASENDSDGKTGYHLAERGSGKLLFEGLARIFPGTQEKRPVVLFGFSRGGQFAHAVAAQFPERVRVWAITGAADTKIEKKTMAPGLVVCGLNDTNTGLSLETFFGGLRAKQRVCWLGVPASGHTVEPRAEAWVREFFEAVLAQPPDAAGIWEEGEFERGLDGFLIRVWFPDEKTQKSWKKFR